VASQSKVELNRWLTTVLTAWPSVGAGAPQQAEHELLCADDDATGALETGIAANGVGSNAFSALETVAGDATAAAGIGAAVDAVRTPDTSRSGLDALDWRSPAGLSVAAAGPRRNSARSADAGAGTVGGRCAVAVGDSAISRSAIPLPVAVRARGALTLGPSVAARGSADAGPVARVDRFGRVVRCWSAGAPAEDALESASGDSADAAAT
jgi:hypothetical protein